MKSKHDCSLLHDSISHLPKLLPNASWSARWMRKINKSLLVSINHPEVFLYLKSSAAIEKESKRQVDVDNFIIHPLSDFKKYWNVIIFVVMLSHLVLTSFSIGFYLDMEDWQNLMLISIDFTLCLVLWTEIAICFRTGFIVKETDEIVIDPKRISKRHLRNFFPDLISSLPYSFLMMWIIDDKRSTINGLAVSYMMFLFIISVYRFSRILFYYSSIPLMLNITEKTSNIIQICLRTFYLWHWASCIRRLVPLYIKNDPMQKPKIIETRSMRKFHVVPVAESAYDDIEELVLADLFELLGNYTLLNKYTRALLVTLKLSLQSGYTYETADSIVSMLMTSFMIIGGWIYSTYILILVSNIIIASSVSENKFQDLIIEIDVYADAKRLSKPLREKMKLFVYRKFQKHYFNEEAIKQSTAVCLRKEIMMHSCSNLVAKVPLFKDMPLILLEKIITCLQFEIYFPNDIIIEAKALGDSMYFITYGTAAIVSSKGEEVKVFFLLITYQLMST